MIEIYSFAPAAELALLLMLQLSIFLNTFRRKIPLLYLCIVGLLIAAVSLGYPKRGYHLMLVASSLYVASCRHWSRQEKRTIFFGLVISLILLLVPELNALKSTFSAGFLDKIRAPKLYPLWMLMIILPAFRKHRALITLCMMATALIAIQVSARGILLGTVAALIVYKFSHKIPAKFYYTILFSSFMTYTFAVPILHSFGYSGYLEMSASNWQRSMMNISALNGTLATYFAMDELSIFTSALDYRYSYDSASLSVHNLFLAFGLFNGLLPMVALLCSVIYLVARHRSSTLAPVMVFSYFYILLGPDSSNTRAALLIIFACAGYGSSEREIWSARKLKSDQKVYSTDRAIGRT